MDTANRPRVRVLMLLLATLSFAGCATHSLPATPVIVQPPQIPAPPADLMEPPPSALLSPNAQADIRRWRQMLEQRP